MNKKIINALLFSRGLGLGHATRDIQIQIELSKACPELSIKYASYQNAYRILKMNKCKVIDLKLPSVGDYYTRMIKIGQLINNEKPRIIISDEELLALPLSRIFNIPSVLITNYFPEEGSPWLTLFNYADRIIFTDSKEYARTPKTISTGVSFVGPIVLRSSLSSADRISLRKTMGLKQKDLVILVSAGGRCEESKILYETAIKAFNRLPISNKRLILLVGNKKEHYLRRGIENCIPKGFLSDVDKYYLISDLVITRGGHTTLWELAYLGVPSISIPFPANVQPFSELQAINMEKRGTTIVIKEENLTVESLLNGIAKIHNSEGKADEMRKSGLNCTKIYGGKKVANIIKEMINSA